MISWSNLSKVNKNKFILDALKSCNPSYAIPEVITVSKQLSDQFFDQKWQRNKLFQFLGRLDCPNWTCTYAAIKRNLEMSAWDPGTHWDIPCSMFWRWISRNWRNLVASFRAQWQELYQHVWRPGMCHFSKVLVLKSWNTKVWGGGDQLLESTMRELEGTHDPEKQAHLCRRSSFQFSHCVELPSQVLTHKLWLTTWNLAEILHFNQFHS